jgi:glycosyltransferase involved in cell wall biosynthesis
VSESTRAIGASKAIVLVGVGWLPITPGGLERYTYDLTHQLAAEANQVEFWGVGVPENLPELPFTLSNLAFPKRPLLMRLWSAYRCFLQRRGPRPDAINLHFALYSLPLLGILPKDVPVTFTFHGPWALEGQGQGDRAWTIFWKQWVEQQVYRRSDRFIVLSKTFAQILHQRYRVPQHKIFIIPGGVNTQHFQDHLSREQAREQLRWPRDRKVLFVARRLVWIGS